MNDNNLIQLMTIVERAVRPVQASTSRKRKMREELLAHVTGVFEEEAAKLGDDSAAVERTALRFGNAADVTRQLQDSVPAGDVISRFFDLDSRPADSTLRHALPLARLAGPFGLVIGIFATAQGWSESPRDALLIGAIFAVVVPLYTFALGLLTNWIEKVIHRHQTEFNPAKHHTLASGLRASIAEALNGPSGRSWLAVVFPVALIADVFFFLMLGIATAIWPARNWIAVAVVLFAVVLAPAGSAICAWVFANSAAVRKCYNEVWARLPIESTS